jgi:hypothetical protein
LFAFGLKPAFSAAATKRPIIRRLKVPKTPSKTGESWPSKCLVGRGYRTEATADYTTDSAICSIYADRQLTNGKPPSLNGHGDWAAGADRFNICLITKYLIIIVFSIGIDGPK